MNSHRTSIERLPLQIVVVKGGEGQVDREIGQALKEVQLRCWEKDLGRLDLSALPPNCMVVLINNQERNAEMEGIVQKLELAGKVYVVYPRGLPGARSVATSPSQLIHHIKEIATSNPSPLSLSSITPNPTKAPTSLHVVVGKSSDQKFRNKMKFLYKRYKENPQIEFFESKAFEKIHPAMFKAVILVVNHEDVERHLEGYKVFLNKMTVNCSLTTVLFSEDMSPVSQEFQCDMVVASKEELDRLIIQKLNAISSTKPKLLSSSSKQPSLRSTSMTTPSGISDLFPSTVLVLDFGDSKYREFYSKLRVNYQHTTHLNHPFSRKTILVVPSSARDLVKELPLIHSNIKIVMVTHETFPADDRSYLPGVWLVTGIVEELTSFLKSEGVSLKRVTDPLGLKNSPLAHLEVPPPLSRVSQNNFEYTLTDENVHDSPSFQTVGSGVVIGTSQVILEEARRNINRMYQHCNIPESRASLTSKDPLKQEQRGRKPSEDRRVLIAVRQNEYVQCPEPSIQTIPKVTSHNLHSERAVEERVTEEKVTTSNDSQSLGLQSHIHGSHVRNSLKSNPHQHSSMLAPPSTISSIQNSHFRQRHNSSDRRSVLRNTPELKYHRHPSQFTSVYQKVPSWTRQHQRVSEYYNEYSGDPQSKHFTRGTRLSSQDRSRSSRPNDKQSVLDCLCDTLSEMMERRSQAPRNQSYVPEGQPSACEQPLQLVFKTDSPYIQHLSHFFYAYPCDLYTFEKHTELPQLVSGLNKSILTLLILNSEVVESMMAFKPFRQFSAILTCKEEYFTTLRERFPQTSLMKENSHKKSSKQVLNFIRYMRLKMEEQEESDEELIPKMSEIRSIRVFCQPQPHIESLITSNLPSAQIVTFETPSQLLHLLEQTLFVEGDNNVVILRSPDEILVKNLLSSVFRIKKLLVYSHSAEFQQLGREIFSLNL